MSVRGTIVDILSGNAEVKAIVADRIRPQRLGEEDEGPSIVVTAVETPWTSLNEGLPDSGEASVRVECSSRDSDEDVAKLAEIVRRAIVPGLASGDRRLTAAWEDPHDPSLDPSNLYGDDDDRFTENVSFTVHWERVNGQ